MSARLTRLILLGVVFTVGCAEPRRTGVGPALPGEPTIRVRIAREVVRAEIAADTTLDIRLPDGSTLQVSEAVSFTYRGGWRLNDVGPPIAAGVIELRSTDDAPITFNDALYPGALRLLPDAPQAPAADASRTVAFDVVNLVHLEAYLPGVLSRELYDDWTRVAHQAQAIAARTYALHQMSLGRDRPYDVVAGPASQAYAGLDAPARAVQAVLDTTGLVLSHEGQLIAGNYSSTCGGIGASPVDAFGSPTALPPMYPQPHEPWCRDSRYFEWGPIRRDLEDLARRLASWGRRSGHPVARLRRIQTLRVHAYNELDRPVRFAVVDQTGEQFLLHAEPFRRACNDRGPGPLDRALRLRSSFVEIRVAGRQALFVGRGFGHGVGLCQYGAEAMAQAGHDAVEILQTYYPDADIARAY